jgi:acyl-CoA reductase-like NAD-dependent aldehyde dehydrogenase
MKLSMTNPANGKLLKEVSEDGPSEIAQKAQASRNAQPSWAAKSIPERIAIFRRFRDLVVLKTETLALTLTDEVGKPITQSRNELKGLLGRLDFFLESTEAELAEEKVFSDGEMTEIIRHEPLGVLANISAWNYPYFVGSNVFVPALLAGNAVLYKPSEFATLTGMNIADLLYEAGVPTEIFALIVGGGGTGATLLQQDIDGVFFTGSHATGLKVAEAASRRLIKLQLELGGKDPAYVCEDVDVTKAALSLADGAFYNTGQSCCSVERIYVHSKIYESFLEAFVSEVKGFRLGDPHDEKTYLGAITRPAQLEVLKRQVEDALAKGAKLHCGGKILPGPGNFFEATVLSNVNHGMELMREESFGPVIGIQKVSGDEEALGLMNDTAYGLTAGVYTKDQPRAERLLSQVDAGSAYWNCCDRVSPRLPWSGRKHSGLGTVLSHYGIKGFTRPKALHLRKPG